MTKGSTDIGPFIFVQFKCVTSFGGLLVHVSVIKDLRGFDNAETSGSY
jgi:hypothetical protein